MKDREVAELMVYLGAVYRHVEVEPPTVAAYAHALRDADTALVNEAARQHVKRSRYFPTPAELLAYTGAGDGIPTAVEAWMQVMEDLSWRERHRNRNTREGEHGRDDGCARPQVHALVRRAAGAVWAGLPTDVPSSYDRGFFLQVYTEFRDAERVRDVRAALPPAAAPAPLGAGGSS